MAPEHFKLTVGRRNLCCPLIVVFLTVIPIHCYFLKNTFLHAQNGACGDIILVGRLFIILCSSIPGIFELRLARVIVLPKIIVPFFYILINIVRDLFRIDAGHLKRYFCVDDWAIPVSVSTVGQYVFLVFRVANIRRFTSLETVYCHPEIHISQLSGDY